MNEKLNLVEILKDCPKGTKLYLTTLGEVEFCQIDSGILPITVKHEDAGEVWLTQEGKLYETFGGECILFPSKEQRDWSRFKFKKERFDPKTLKPFDRVIIRDSSNAKWSCILFSHIDKESNSGCQYVCEGLIWRYCIPYNDDTKHLVGTTEEAPEYYRYWED